MTSYQSSSGKTTEIWGELIPALLLLTPKERRSFSIYAALSIFSGLLDTIALASTMPFIALLVDMNAALANSKIAAVRKLVSEPTPSGLVLIVGSMCFVLVLTSSLLSFALQRLTNQFVANCQARLARDVMDALVNAPYVWFLGVNTQAVSHVFQRDVMLWARELVNKLLNITRDVVLIVMPLVLVLIVTPTVGILTFIIIAALIFCVIRLVHPRIAALTRIKNEADERAYTLSGQALGGIKDIAISGRQSEFVDSFARSYAIYTSSNAEMQNQHQLPSKAILLLGQIGLLAVAGVLWCFGSDSGTLAAQLSLLVLVTSRVVPAANRLSSAMTTFFGVLPAVRGIHETLDEINRAGRVERGKVPKRPINRPWHRIEFVDVGFSYPKTDMPAIRNISLLIEAGKSYGIVGASGAGKSTVVDLLLGLIAPSFGHIAVDGVLIDEASLASWQSGIGYVPQVPFILDDTLSANIAFGIPSAKRDPLRLSHAIAAANLSDLMVGLPDGIDTNLGERGVRISGGQRQRVAIARALYDECDLLVLDEATAALDTVSERAVQDAISSLAGKVTTVAIAHRLSTVRDCDRIFFFEKGRLVSEGAWSELLANSPAFRKMADPGKKSGLAA